MPAFGGSFWATAASLVRFPPPTSSWLSWCRRGVPLEQAEHAIYLGVARKYAALLNNGKGPPITALSYFEHLIAEVAHAEVSPNYWRHVKDRTEQFERRWQTASRPESTPTEETK